MAFFPASRDGDMQSLHAADVVVHSDGGGKRSAALEPIVGYDAVLQLHEVLGRLFAREPSQLVQLGYIDGLPGFIALEGGDVLQTTASSWRTGRSKPSTSCAILTSSGT
jgi:RNA polymerase sigma-70 factor (ECF subfamily)